MTEGFEGVRQLSQTISGGIAEHLNAPPHKKNLNRASWGAGLIAGGAYLAYSYVQGLTPAQAVQGYINVLHRPWDDSWPFHAWGAVMLFGLLWIVVGMKGTRGYPRDIMAAFWSVIWIVVAGAGLWLGWYTDNYPVLNWFLKDGYIVALASSVMCLFLALRGPGNASAAQAVRSHIFSQMRIFRIGRARRF